MTAANEQLDDILGPEPVVEETTEQVAEQVTEQASSAPEQTTEQTSEVPRETETPDPDEIVKSYKAMAHQERMERKQLQQQLQVTQQRFEQLMAAMQPQEPQTPEPVYEEDPLGATYKKVDDVSKSLQQLQAESAQRKQAEQYSGYVNAVRADEQAFMQKTPDYKDAVTFLQTRRLGELQAMGYPEDNAMQVLAQDAMALTARAQQLGESPAAFAYKMAKQLGYTAKQASNIEQIAAGQAVARSVAGGANPVNEGSIPPNLAEMSDDEFDAMFKKMTKK